MPGGGGSDGVTMLRRPPTMSGKNENSASNEVLSQGIWRPLESSRTPSRTRLKTSSIDVPGRSMLASKCCVYKPLVPLPSLATLPGEVAKAISEPVGASSCDRPPLPALPSLTNGLSRQASRITTFIRLRALPMRSSNCWTSTPRVGTSASRRISAPTGSR